MWRELCPCSKSALIHECRWLEGVCLPYNEATLLMKFHICLFYVCSAALTFLGNIGQHLRCILDENICLFERLSYQRKVIKKFGALRIRHLSFISHEVHITEDDYLHINANGGWLKSNQLNPDVSFFKK